MSFLGPLGAQLFAYFAIGAAALAVGAYIIKMRRRRFEVPWVQLWKRVLEQKDANALWKQLKRLISLLLILLILGLVLFAALDPTLGVQDRKARSVVVLLDASASMKTMDGNEAGTQSRMDAALEKADALIDSMGGGDVAMLVKVDGQATPMSRFTNDKAILHKLIHGVGGGKHDSLLLDGITASDTPADLTRALGAAADALRDRKNPLVVLISDGAFPESQLGLVSWNKNEPVMPQVGSAGPQNPAKNLAAIDLSGIDVRYLPVGRRSDNVGIISFNVRRYIANKAAYEVFIEIQNFGTEPAKRKLLLQNGSNTVEQRDIELAPGQRIRRVYEKLPASDDNKLTAKLSHLDGPGGSDAFPLDDFAYALLPARKKQKVLMVTEDNLFLEGALLVYDNVDPLKVTPAEYTAKPSIADGMDVVIFDDFTPEAVPMPPTSLLYFHPTGEHSPIKVGSELSNPRITEIDEDHPVMRWVTMSDVYTDKSNLFQIDPRQGESSLAYSVRDSIVAAKRDGRRKILAFGFSLPAANRESATDLPMRVAFPMLLVNTLDWFAGDQADLLTTYPTGQRERIPLDGVVGATEAEVKAPDGSVTRTPVIDGLATFYGNRQGYYDVTAKDAQGKPMANISLAANLASTQESDIAPSATLSLGGKKLEAPEAFEITRSQKLWWYFIAIAMILIITEWITYHRRITV
ncbi:MAG TPA: VWA domain-containing protein [Kofleriaceae bacterium]|nr:VWA domain-containing protein [Kofleriaceae bacterium]